MPNDLEKITYRTNTNQIPFISSCKKIYVMVLTNAVFFILKTLQFRIYVLKTQTLRAEIILQNLRGL